ncbi:MAG: hypothetical protein WCV62_06870 [Candidatus Peribacteraceae bacterium]|jgi:hypothetical protein
MFTNEHSITKADIRAFCAQDGEKCDHYRNDGTCDKDKKILTDAQERRIMPMRVHEAYRLVQTILTRPISQQQQRVRAKLCRYAMKDGASGTMDAEGFTPVIDIELFRYIDTE